MVSKFITRKTIKDKRTFLSAEFVSRLSSEICKTLFAMPEYRSADTICLYISANNEVDTTPIIEHALYSGKQVAAPRVLGRDMEFIAFSHMSELASGAFGILEPVGEQVVSTRDALLIMPGVAFDEQCNRIGYGGGFYDRYLSSHEAAVKIALAYELQVVRQLDAEVFDVKPDIVITEKRMIMNPHIE